MKLSRFINTFSLTAFFTLSSVVPSFAQALCPKDENGFNKLCFTGEGNEVLSNVIGTAISIAFFIAVLVALFYLIWGGIKWILSGGDKGAVETARGTIIAAVIGLIVTFAAYFILNLVLTFFGLSLNNIKIPQFHT